MRRGACAAYIVLLAAHGRGLAGYWRTPAVLRTPEGRAALGIGDDEHAIGLLHLGPPRQEQRVPERAPARDVVSYLDLTRATPSGGARHELGRREGRRPTTASRRRAHSVAIGRAGPRRRRSRSRRDVTP